MPNDVSINIEQVLRNSNGFFDVANAVRGLNSSTSDVASTAKNAASVGVSSSLPHALDQFRQLWCLQAEVLGDAIRGLGNLVQEYAVSVGEVDQQAAQTMDAEF